VPANVCSNTLTQNVAGVAAQLWPVPVCVPPPAAGGNCDPAPRASDPDGLKVHYCDGLDDPSSPGVCVPFNPRNPQPGRGSCYPVCRFGTDGSVAAGCAVGDTCAFLGYTLVQTDAGMVAQGVGYCQGTCQADADCAPLGAGYVCQSDVGYCTLHPVARTKSLGDACTAADSDAGLCDCFTGASGKGYCSTRCIVGGAACPAGWVCDTGEPNAATFVGLAASFPVARPTLGMVGTCAPACALPVDAGVDGSSSDAGDASVLGDGASDATAVSDGADGGAPSDAGATDGASADATTDAADAGPASDAADASPTADAADGGPTTDAGAPDGSRESAADTGTDAVADADAGPSTGNGCPANSACVGGGAVGADCLPR
jgi:hypothetical protein